MGKGQVKPKKISLGFSLFKEKKYANKFFPGRIKKLDPNTFLEMWTRFEGPIPFLRHRIFHVEGNSGLLLGWNAKRGRWEFRRMDFKDDGWLGYIHPIKIMKSD